jgi:hypothetical protein
MQLKKLALLFVLLAFSSMAAFADAVTFTAPTLTDDAGGSFIDGNSYSTTSNSMIINLPNYVTSNFESFFANQVNFGVGITPSSSDTITSVTVSFFGRFSDEASAAYTLTGDPGGTFSSLPFSVVIPFSLSSGQALNLLGQLNLDDGGGTAAINQIEIDVTTVPEPFSLSLMGIGAAAMGLKKRFSARN